MRKHLMERGIDKGEWKLLRAGPLEIHLERVIESYICLVLTLRVSLKFHDLAN